MHTSLDWNRGEARLRPRPTSAPPMGSAPRSRGRFRLSLGVCVAHAVCAALLAMSAPSARALAGSNAGSGLPETRGPSAGGIYEATLDNGLVVLMKQVTTSPIVCVSIWYRAGSKHESNGTTGLAHLLEHMMFKGTHEHGKGVYDELLESNGGVNNATTWLDRTNYYAIVAKDKIDLAMELEADRMRGALFTEEDLEDEMPVVRNEMEKGEDDPHTELDERIGSLAILEHPYHWPTIGWKSDVEAITAAQIHDYYDRFYQPNNAYLVLVGDLPVETLLAKAVEHFGSIPPGGAEPVTVTEEPHQKGERRFLIREAGNTRLLGIAFRTPERAHGETPALDLLGRLLADGKASRLHRALVDTGQAVWVNAYNQSFADPYLFFIYVMLTDQGDPDRVEETIYAELTRLRDMGPEDAEMARVRKRAKVATLFERDDLSGLMFSIGEAEISGGYALHDSYLDDLDAVTTDQVQKVLRRYCHADGRTVGLYLPRGAEGGSWIAREEDDLPARGTESDVGAREGSHGRTSREPEAAQGRRPASVFATGTAASRAAGTGAGGALSATRPPMSSAGSSAADPAAPAPATTAATIRTVLDNGMTLLVRESRENPTVALSARLQGGLLLEPAGKEGVASWLAETLPLGAGDLDAAQFSERLESLGVDIRFTAKRDAIEVEARCLAEDFAAMVALLNQAILQPRFDPSSLEQARVRQVARLQEDLDDTYQVAYHRALEELYGLDSPFARSVYGSKGTIAALAREDLVAYHRELLHGRRWTFAVVGDVSAEEAGRILAAEFAAMPAGEPVRVEAPRLQAPGECRVIRVPMADRSQADLVFVGPGVEPGAEGRWAAHVANVVLGGSFTARLNRKLRDDEGLTYWAGSWFEDLEGGTHWVATLGVNPENVDAALAGVQRELGELVANGMGEDELVRAKEYAAGTFPIGLASKTDVAHALLAAERFGYGVDYIEAYGDRIRAQSEADAERATPRFASSNHLVVVIAGSLGEESAAPPAEGERRP